MAPGAYEVKNNWRRVQDLNLQGLLPLVFETSAIPLGEPSVLKI